MRCVFANRGVSDDVPPERPHQQVQRFDESIDDEKKKKDTSASIFEPWWRQPRDPRELLRRIFAELDEVRRDRCEVDWYSRELISLRQQLVPILPWQAQPAATVCIVRDRWANTSAEAFSGVQETRRHSHDAPTPTRPAHCPHCTAATARRRCRQHSRRYFLFSRPCPVQP